MSTTEDQSLILCKIEKKKKMIEKNNQINIKENKSILSRNSKVENRSAKSSVYADRSIKRDGITILLDASLKKAIKNKNNMNKRNKSTIRIREILIEKAKKSVNRLYNELSKLSGKNYEPFKYNKYSLEDEDESKINVELEEDDDEKDNAEKQNISDEEEEKVYAKEKNDVKYCNEGDTETDED